MGDAADDLTEQGLNAWLAHLAGICEDFCEYCEAENREPEDPRVIKSDD